MIGAAFRGALGFLTRLPVGHGERAFDAFRTTPAAFPLAGYVVGLLLAPAVALPVPAPTVAFSLVVGVVLVTGVNHADGLADLGDAAVVHGDAERRREVMADTTVGVGALLALGVDLVGIALAGLALAALPVAGAVVVVLASEVGAKLAMATLICRGTPSHEGFGSSFLNEADGRDLWLPVVVALPAVALGWLAGGSGLLATGSALIGAVAVALAVERWAAVTLGGVGGDVLGAANDLARLAALHLGVIAWTLW
ncbi:MULTISPECIES: adenosylcobinamide-GDP ribazoletransferase [Halomicrobium]|uniref:Adenosylcobinamide-GDP ribazoletransferase n=2 Tax=Halomicrobium mukohataei TaxID=57705 RepID=C7NWE0_HALMD|nr:MULTISPECIES: adenosylcobinamide-GDP ribazoletransferase [Halomicrobium]ACV46281.1 cobalamin 5'-phosphate synthase [Halomicrobium mukohataei DSM 12286]QCD64841.1 adenosylcobinamide-GDP ribazoletransferase [Halomicrobium mukohataei]QFR19648.1 adenosylcobinamide-GDP ribazoletransferase [Halomicrobium sp. ZPS1]